MEPVTKLIIGTRGSALALAQTNLVISALKKAHPSLAITTKIITTKGDLNQSPIPQDAVGKTWFTEEIEQALVSGEIDLAVHSLKDLPPDLRDGLTAFAVLPRADAADVLISKSGTTLADLPRGAVIGTDSARRRALLLDTRPDLIVKSIRGNVDTRLKKLMNDAEGYDAIVIAAAGLERLGASDRITERLDPITFIPAPGQGILAVELLRERADVIALLSAIIHEPTTLASETERAFSEAVGGGCKLPVGCYTTIDDTNTTITINAAIGNAEEAKNANNNFVIRKSIKGPTADRLSLAKALAKDLQ